MDLITIKGLEIFAYHGVNPEEKQDGQNFVLDISLSADLTAAKETDDLNDTISYSAVKKTVVKAFTAEKYNLIERAAKVVCDAVLSEHEKTEEITLTLKKPEAPMSGKFLYTAVTITQRRK